MGAEMAGETVKSEAICLSVRPWSRTSHVISWLTPSGRVTTLVKGAVRPKSAFLGQYDLNYTCEIVYYSRAHGELHALRECSPTEMRESLRHDYRALALAGYFCMLVERFAPQGDDAIAWFRELSGALDFACRGVGGPGAAAMQLLFFEIKVLVLLGLGPEIESAVGSFALRGERAVPISSDVAELLGSLSASPEPPSVAGDFPIPLDALRVIGVYYSLHLDLPLDVRRSVLGVVSKTAERG